MTSSIGIKVVCLLIIAAMVAAPPAVAAISCREVLGRLSTCLEYLQRGGDVSPSCCDGVKTLNDEAATTSDRQTVCGCIKTLAPEVGARPDFINGLPAKCGVNIPYQYSPSMDCSKVQ